MLRSARNHYRLSALIARRAVREARKVRSRGFLAVATVVASHQAAQAASSWQAVDAMLAEQRIDEVAEAMLNSLSFTTAADTFEQMAQVAGDANFDRLVESIVQDAGRAAESVATTVRRDIGHVRNLTPPSCARCAVLAGRVYRYSDGFQRHPNCDCTMTPVREGDAQLAVDLDQMIRDGNVRGLSKADLTALRDGADLGQVVNIRQRSAGLTESGRVLARAGRLTPEGIYRLASSREEAVELLARNGYIR